jgi:hypothetical protein
MTKFVGLSGVLRSGAFGHHEAFHKGLYLALTKSTIYSNVVFLGSAVSEPSWFKPVVPPSFVSEHPWSSKNFESELLRRSQEGGASEVIIHVYEGDLYALHILSRVMRNNYQIRVVINLFNSVKVCGQLDGKIRVELFALQLRMAVQGLENRIVVTADSTRMAEKISAAIGLDIQKYPVYSILDSENFKSCIRSEVLILVRGTNAMDKLIRTLEQAPSYFRDRVTIHGVPTEEQAHCLNVLKVGFSRQHLHDKEYTNFYLRFKYVVVLYDPEFFKNQSSGRLCDAIVAGAHVIVPRDCALWDTANEYGGFSDFDFEKTDQIIEIIESNESPVYSRNLLPPPDVQAAIAKLTEMIEVSRYAEVSTRRDKSFYLFSWFLIRLYLFKRLRNEAILRLRRLIGLI